MRVKGEEIIPNTLFKINYLHQTDVYTVPKTQIYTQPNVDWYRGYGAITPSHPGCKLAGPLCTAFSSARQPQRRHESPPVARNRKEIADKFRLKTRLPCHFQRSLTCRKSVTWDTRLYFPSEGRRAEDFFARKIRRLQLGLNPQSWITEASTLTTRKTKAATTNCKNCNKSEDKS
jgi:hypothetical protein